MTIEAKLDLIIANQGTSTPPVDLTPVLTAISTLDAKVTALAGVVGTETPPAA